MRLLFLTISLALLHTAPSRAGDVRLIHLEAANTHLASQVWRGVFRGLNGEDYNTRAFYKSQKPEFSASGIFLLNPKQRVSLLLPVALDAGYQATLYQAQPMFGLGIGAAISLSKYSVLSLKADNLLVAGGRVSERPCYDGYRRRFHCGSGQSWTDFQAGDSDRRLTEPAFYARYIKRFSF